MSTGLVAGRYRLYEPVGAGGMGRVWLARDEMLHRDVAIKEVTFPSWLTESERSDLRARTLREARTAARINHPNVIQIYDVVHSEEQPWIVMEYVPSRSLQEVIKQDGVLTPERAAQIGLAVLAGLRTAHNSTVLHRDVKPHNVLIGANGRVVLTDFGLATFDGGDGAVTRAGLILGSPQFVAPERARAGISTVESDLWSLGATLYAAVEGHSPYARPTTMATLAALATEPPDPAPHAGHLRPVINGLLRKDPKQRLGAEQVEQMLRRVAVGVHRHARILPRPRRAVEEISPEVASAPTADLGDRRHRWWLVAAAVAVLIVAAGLAAAALLRPGPDPLADPGPRSSTTGPASGSGGERLIGVQACTDPDAVTSALVIPPTDADKGLISGRVWHLDPTGFKIGLPRNWRQFRIDDMVCFRGPETYPVLAVTVLPADIDPVAELKRQESMLRRSSTAPRYEQTTMVGFAFPQPAGDWEYRFDGPGGARMHGIYRLVSSWTDELSFGFHWLTTEASWPAQWTTAFSSLGPNE